MEKCWYQWQRWLSCILLVVLEREKLSGPKNSRIKNKVLPSRREKERGALKKKLGLDVVFFLCVMYTQTAAAMVIHCKKWWEFLLFFVHKHFTNFLGWWCRVLVKIAQKGLEWLIALVVWPKHSLDHLQVVGIDIVRTQVLGHFLSTLLCTFQTFW